MASNFECYIDPKIYNGEIDKLKNQLTKLQAIADKYEAMKNRAAQAWGDEDENLTKARQICESAIKVVQQKIDTTNACIKAISEVLQQGQEAQQQMGAALDQGNQIVQNILG